MRQRIRKIILIAAILLGWINMPAQAFLLDDQNLWLVMAQNFSLPADVHHSNVQRQLQRDIQNPKYILRLTQNAKPYLYYVFQETKKLHLPAELALIPMIESDYIPGGSSKRGAVGLWQLMPDTASGYGIKMNSWYDGRRNTETSTKAALNFLSYLYTTFNHNWLLALAAYNAGPGTVMTAIRYNQQHGKPTDFWALPLPRQTKHYIPKLLALAAIIQHPHTYGVHLAPVPNKALTDTVTINKQMKLKTIAVLAHTSVHTVKKLNPALRRETTPPHQVLALVLPANTKTGFVQHLKDSVVEKKVTGTTGVKSSITKTKIVKVTEPQPQNQTVSKQTLYKVRYGDNLGIIAHRHHLTRKQLEKWNHLTGRSLLHEGQKLVLLSPHKVVTKVITTQKKVTTQAKHTKTTSKIYIVRRGDTLRKIAKRHHTTVAHLMASDHLRTSHLQIGEHLDI